MACLVRTFLFMFMLIFVGSLFANGADAQVARAIARNVGVFSSDGYHSQSPLVDSDYYNPWSATNHTYISPEANASRLSEINHYPSHGLYGDALGSYPGRGAYSGNFRNISLRPLSKWHGSVRGNWLGRN